MPRELNLRAWKSVTNLLNMSPKDGILLEDTGPQVTFADFPSPPAKDSVSLKAVHGESSYPDQRPITPWSASQTPDSRFSAFENPRPAPMPRKVKLWLATSGFSSGTFATVSSSCESSFQSSTRRQGSCSSSRRGIEVERRNMFRCGRCQKLVQPLRVERWSENNQSHTCLPPEEDVEGEAEANEEWKINEL